ncbi:TorA maturation chaperone TorD [Sulfuritortus calidifontis]|uniref:TorA maturation chaperone TorD n=1 Tax=Sulfuritortus calidifontis TaxID=1914471 RepID=A0A4R3JV08_9PROT|nr:molecular chaperone TorD family protein [Sulfuritortus calidifontis]TCS71754.1 TorA maturation chaperone TorD [Sulfuritortus calidifontis]
MTAQLTHHPAAEAAAATILWGTLGRVFLPPLQVDLWRAMQAELPLDLAEWVAELDLNDTLRVDDLIGALQAYPEHEALLVHHSGLFYVPPVRVPLNLGQYLDGALNGPSLDALERWHSAFGLHKRDDFYDLADHLTAVLEFLALVAERGEPGQAAIFANTFLLPALPRLIARIEVEAVDSPYAWLARFTHAALARCYPSDGLPTGRDRPRYRIRPVGDGWRRCTRCDQPIATERELAVLEKALTGAGLPIDHLSLCLDCRDAARGWEHRPLPTMRR